MHYELSQHITWPVPEGIIQFALRGPTEEGPPWHTADRIITYCYNYNTLTAETVMTHRGQNHNILLQLQHTTETVMTH